MIDLGESAEVDQHADFTAIGEASVSNACTPRTSRAALGLAINVPREVRVAARPELPLAGCCRFPEGAFGWRAANAIAFVAIDRDSHRARVAQHTFAPEENAFPAPPAVPDPSRRLGEYFNVDLAPLHSLPARSARYLCFAALGAHRSNVLATEVRCQAERDAPLETAPSRPAWLGRVEVALPRDLEPLDAPGIALQAFSQGRRCVLRGQYRVAAAHAAAIVPALPGALVLVVSSMALAAALNPAREVALLEDDLWRDGGDLGGAFSIELALEQLPPGRYGAFVSLGEHVSRGAAFEV